MCAPVFLVAKHKVGLKCCHSRSACCASQARFLGSASRSGGRNFVMLVAKGNQGQALGDSMLRRNIQSLVVGTGTDIGVYSAMWGGNAGRKNLLS